MEFNIDKTLENIREMEIHILGNFSVPSGKLTISDPCYDPDTWCRLGEIESPSVELTAFIAKNYNEFLGDRVFMLGVFPKSTELSPSVIRAILVSQYVDKLIGEPNFSDIGVDSGQMGIFDYNDQPWIGDFPITDSNVENNYGNICNGTDSPLQAVIYKNGVYSSSGIGDGIYCADIYQITEKEYMLVVDFALLAVVNDEEEDED